MSPARRLARALARWAARLMPPGRQPWATAMLAEVDGIEDDGAALAWAVGCLITGCKERIGAMDVLRSVWMRWLLVLFIAHQAFEVLFAPAMILAWRAHALGLTQALGRSTPGDDYRRFVPLMDATPDWMIGLAIVAGGLYLVSAWRLLLDRRGAFVLFAVAFGLELASMGAKYVIPGYAELSHATFTFPEPNIRRDVLIPTALALLPALLALALWGRERVQQRAA